MTEAKLDPIQEFQTWFQEAKQTALRDPNAMALATVSPTGQPQVRMVLMKDFDARGLVFYTNYTSAKARDLDHHAHASACFFWETTRKQVRVSGIVERVSEAEADAYFHSRPRDSQIGAWASLQSQHLGSRQEFEQRFATYRDSFGDGPVPRPAHWSGFRIIPESLEFWIEKPFRLHDRYIYRRASRDAAWTRTLLYP